MVGMPGWGSMYSCVHKITKMSDGFPSPDLFLVLDTWEFERPCFSKVRSEMHETLAFVSHMHMCAFQIFRDVLRYAILAGYSNMRREGQTGYAQAIPRPSASLK